jgi:hypothetical protein
MAGQVDENESRILPQNQLPGVKPASTAACDGTRIEIKDSLMLVADNGPLPQFGPPHAATAGDGKTTAASPIHS